MCYFFTSGSLCFRPVTIMTITKSRKQSYQPFQSNWLFLAFVIMNNQQAVVDQIVQNLAFEVEAVPKNELIQTTSMSQSTPLNVKIKVKKKDEIYKRYDASSIASRTVQKVRLVNSDRTIMTFDVFMEAEFEKKPSRKLRKHIFDILRPGNYLLI